MTAFKQNPAAAIAHHQFRSVDEQGSELGRPWPEAVWTGDIRHRLVRSGGWLPRPTTSGYAFSRAYLNQVLTMPTGSRIWPDTYLAPLASMQGPIIGISRPLRRYRVHGEKTILKSFSAASTSSEPVDRASSVLSQFEMEYELLLSAVEQHASCEQSQHQRQSGVCDRALGGGILRHV